MKKFTVPVEFTFSMYSPWKPVAPASRCWITVPVAEPGSIFTHAASEKSPVPVNAAGVPISTPSSMPSSASAPPVMPVLHAAPLTALIASYSSPEGLFWAKLSAVSTLACAPILIFGWISQKQLVRGLSFGAVK